METNNTLRNALSMLVDACDSFHQFIENGLDGHYEAIPRYDSGADDFLRCVDDAKSALAEPVKNCEVGTVEEQSKRKMEFCYQQGGCINCSFSRGATLTQCALAWAQMPYKEGGAK